MQDAGWMPSKPRDPPDDGEYTIVDTAVRKYHKEWEKDKQVRCNRYMLSNVPK